mgnify:CR=1 FL=1
MKKRDFLKLFDRKKSHLDTRIKRDYVKNGVATIFCQISSYNDVITAYSVKDHEAVNLDFIEYVKGAAKVIPDEYPLVLNIIEENCLSAKEQQTIREVIRDDFAYDFGMAEQEEDRQWYMFIGMLIGTIIAGILLGLTETLDEVPRELFFVLFWFAGDRMFEYLFLTGRDLRNERRLAGRLASIKVIFSKTYEPPDYNEQDLDKLYTELAQDTHENP